MSRSSAGPVCVALLALLAGSAGAQDFAFPWNPRSGDARLDRQLADINAYAQRYPDAYIDEVVRYRAAPRNLVTGLVQHMRWAPGDVYYACTLAQAVVRPCADVVNVWARDHAQGWEQVATELGAAPGSEQADAIERAIAGSYARWERPRVTKEVPVREAHKRDPAR